MFCLFLHSFRNRRLWLGVEGRNAHPWFRTQKGIQKTISDFDDDSSGTIEYEEILMMMTLWKCCLHPTVCSSDSHSTSSNRYVDWLLNVPLLLMELILVMGLPADQPRSLSCTIGLSSAMRTPGFEPKRGFRRRSQTSTMTAVAPSSTKRS